MKHQVKYLGYTTVLLLLALTGCGMLANADTLDGTSWTVTEMGGTPLVEGSAITVQFNDGQIGGSAGCNSYGGTYEITEEGVQVSDLASTLMACTDEGIMEQEQRFLDAVQNIDSFNVSGDQLSITSADGTEIVLVPAVLTEAATSTP